MHYIERNLLESLICREYSLGKPQFVKFFLCTTGQLCCFWCSLFWQDLRFHQLWCGRPNPPVFLLSFTHPSRLSQLLHPDGLLSMMDAVDNAFTADTQTHDTAPRSALHPAAMPMFCNWGLVLFLKIWKRLCPFIFISGSVVNLTRVLNSDYREAFIAYFWILLWSFFFFFYKYRRTGLF